MKNPIVIFSLLLLGIRCTLMAQEPKFDKVTREELLETSYALDSTASAAVLSRKVTISFEYLPADGFHVITFVHERVKIYKEAGFQYATITENLYRTDTDRESLDNLKGYTYNLEGDEIVESRIKGSETFSKELNKYYNQVTFTMPNVKEGSIIDYQYRLNSPFSYSIDEIKLQYDIPIQDQLISVSVPEYYYFKPLIKGYLPVSPTFSNKMGKISFATRNSGSNPYHNSGSYSQRSLDYRVTTTNFALREVPALAEEPFVNDIDNYRSAVNYELQYVQFPQAARKDYSGTWESVAKTIRTSDDFGRQLSQSRFFRDRISEILVAGEDEDQQLARIYRYVQERMNWNGYLGYASEKGVKDAYEAQSGNIADINLMLIGLLQEAGFDAKPVLLSTRDNGIPLFPTLQGFNYVIAAVQQNGQYLLLDASNKLVYPGMLPVHALNWHGTMLEDDGSSAMLPVMPDKPSSEIQMMNLSLGTDGIVQGKVRNTFTDYKAFEVRSALGSSEEEEYLGTLENKYPGLEIDAYTVDNVKEYGSSVVENYGIHLEGYLQVAPDKILFTPLLHQALSMNPFRSDTREFPVDFAYPREVKHMYTINLPEGYEVAHLPEGLRMALPENMGMFNYNLRDMGNGKLQLVSQLNLNQAVIPAQYYPLLKEFYKKVVEKETEKVVLSKISQDELTELPTGR